MPNNITKIRKFLKDWVYFDFSGLNKNVVPIPDDTDIAVLTLRKSVKSFLTGDEEE